MWLVRLVAICGFLTACGGCPTSTSTSTERNPFLTYVETYGAALSATTSTTGSGASAVVGAAQAFRRPLTLTFANTHPSGVVDTSFIAWVEVSSLRTANQQDSLLAGGYTQLTHSVDIGTAYTLSLGTFVFNGPGTAGATPVTIRPATAPTTGTQATPTTISFTLPTPDKILVFSQPPVSCDSVAFAFSDPLTGEVLPCSTPGAEGGGEQFADFSACGYKTVAQVDVYQCDPFQPGLSFNSVGGQFKANEYDEGDTITFTFLPAATQGAFATVVRGTAGTQAATSSP